MRELALGEQHHRLKRRERASKGWHHSVFAIPRRLADRGTVRLQNSSWLTSYWSTRESQCLRGLTRFGSWPQPLAALWSLAQSMVVDFEQFKMPTFPPVNSALREK